MPVALVGLVGEALLIKCLTCGDQTTLPKRAYVVGCRAYCRACGAALSHPYLSDVKRVVDLTPALPRGEAPGPLLALAVYGAYVRHAWYFDPVENSDALPPEGHVQPFITCPHPDCALVRRAAPGPPPEPAK